MQRPRREPSVPTPHPWIGSFGTSGWRGIVLVGAVALLAAACGSTVPLTERQERALRSGTDAGLDPSGLETLDDTGIAASGDGPGAGGAVRTSRAGGSGTATRGGAAAGPGGGAPPVTETELKVGIAYIRDPGAGNAAAGFAGIGQVDQKRAWDAMVAEVNKNPPHGRKVVPVYYSYSTNDVLSKGAEQIAQEQCAHWTKDNRVFLVWGSATDALRACLTKEGVAHMGSALGFSYDKTFRDHPWYVEHNSSALDRMAQFQVDQLVERGFFDTCKPDPSTEPCVDGKPRIGLIRYDQPSHKAAGERMKRTLASHGLSLCGGCEFEVSYSNDNIANQLDDATEVNNAINNCRTAKTVPGSPDTPAGPCTHMLFLGSTAGVRITLFYVQRAEDQRYRAKLGFNTMDAPMAVRNFYAGQGQRQYFNQFKQSMLVSYSPGDMSLRPDAFQDCKQIFERAGETFGGSDDSAGNKENQIPFYCDTAWYHLAAFNAVGPTVNLDTWLRGVANSGPVKSADTFLMQTNANRRDGAGAVRIGEWFDDCECIKPVSGDIPV